MVLFVFLHLEAFLRMSLIVKNHHFSVRVFIGVPAFDVTFLIRNFVSLLGVFVISRGVTKLVTVRTMDTLSMNQIRVRAKS